MAVNDTKHLQTTSLADNVRRFSFSLGTCLLVLSLLPAALGFVVAVTDLLQWSVGFVLSLIFGPQGFGWDLLFANWVVEVFGVSGPAENWVITTAAFLPYAVELTLIVALLGYVGTSTSNVVAFLIIASSAGQHFVGATILGFPLKPEVITLHALSALIFLGVWLAVTRQVARNRSNNGISGPSNKSKALDIAIVLVLVGLGAYGWHVLLSMQFQ